jgi:UDP-glucose 4-epimerase
MVPARTALVTGASGFVGRATTVALERAGWSVVRGSRSSRRSDTATVKVDLARPETLFVLANEMRADAIVHLGAMVDFADDAGARLFAPNVLSTGCVARLGAQWEAPIVFASTATVHGIATTAIRQDSPVVPDAPYAKSKWLAEELIAAAGVEHCVLRIGGVFGPEGPAHLGVNRAISDARNGQSPTIVGSGAALRNYVYVGDVASAIVFALEGGLRGTHLLAGDDVLPIADMLREICDVFLPGHGPLTADGPEAQNQVIIPSPRLPKTHTWREALVDIRDGSRK